MVMKKNMMRKNLRQSILKSMGRYLAIAAIIALGSSMFVGLRATKSDMVATGQKFTDDQNMFDFRLMNTYGWEQEDVEKIAALDAVTDAEGMVTLDVIVQVGDAEGADSVYRFHNIPETVNRIDLRGGRMPEQPDECLVDGFRYDDAILGTRITLSDENGQDTLDSLAYRTYTVVGYVATPLYMDMNRGNTSVGSGTLASYIYIPMEGFDVDYYTEVDITIPGDYAIYTDEYEHALDAAADILEPQVQQLADDRFAGIVEEAESEYADGYAEYEDGLKEFENGIAEANQELADAYQKLTEAEQELKENEWLLYDGQLQINDAKETLNQSAAELESGKAELEQQKTDAYAQLDEAKAELDANAATVISNLEQVNDGIASMHEGLKQLDDGIAQLEDGINQLDAGIGQLEQAKAQTEEGLQTVQAALEAADLAPEPDQQLIAQLEEQLAQIQGQLEYINQQITPLVRQRDGYAQQLDDLKAQKAEHDPQYEQLQLTRISLEEAQAAIEEGYTKLEESRAQADAEFAAAQLQIADGEAQLEDGWAQIAQKEQQIANGWVQIAQGRQEIADGWAEYEDGVKEVEEAYQEGKAELDEAAEELADARADIDALEKPSVYILDRYTNVGFASLDSNSDIVAGVSRVFPIFFLLIAALVCITTMTRMVNEERTQIGTLKAMGYGSGAIIGKYLAYAGSGALVGCGLGVTLGSIIFPKILWAAYWIMLYITPDVVIQFDWPLCIGVVLVYTVVMLLTTWYCCHRVLDEVPAELIRPKAPTSGKKIFLEHFWFWNKISFLNKVTIRNIFRYRQRLAMMLVGIGGCTALLVTGFGLRDSIVDVVDFQFEEVTVYDLEVYFTEGQTPAEQEKFLNEISDDTQDAMFFHQTSVEVDFGNQVREIYLIAGGDRIRDFIDLHSGDTSLEMPGVNEMVLSVGVAEAMGIKAGDRVILRDSDMRELELSISAVYDNNIYNYAIVLPETIEAQWNETPQEQMAFVKVGEDRDIHETGAKIAGLDDVMNVSVSDDLAGMVGSMMEALDLVVVTVVICAGMLAVIVLYNLTNININERIREIATIKVLGFNASETAAYVFKENLALSVMGSVLGLFLGKLLLEFVMSQIKIDFCWFQARVMPMSYLFAIVLTMLSALVVDVIFRFKLDRINMAEALKSVE